jgi:hypothetical protein
LKSVHYGKCSEREKVEVIFMEGIGKFYSWRKSFTFPYPGQGVEEFFIAAHKAGHASCGKVTIPVSISDLKPVPGIKVYPIPASETLTVDVELGMRVSIYNIFGECVYSKELNAGENAIRINELKKGIYSLIAGNETATWTKKILIE